VTGSYDPESNLVYWGVGNPGPDWNADSRLGDNLYTCSLVALDGDTGALKWHFQFTPHDTHDWDSAHVPVLFEAEVRGIKRKLVAVANRNAFFYVLDRSAEGTVMYPNLNGATVWFSPSYSPLTGLFYVSVRELGSIYYKREADYKPGTFFAGGGEADIPHDEKKGAIRALEVATGKLRWEFPLNTAAWSGVLSTGGGLVFSGSDEGNFFALDAVNGKPLWDFQTGGAIASNPISFNVNGKQHVAIAADRVLYVFGL
jgi:alcohol dehydrogenase (cytochrome c)